jgi:hypothetical protein
MVRACVTIIILLRVLRYITDRSINDDIRSTMGIESSCSMNTIVDMRMHDESVDTKTNTKNRMILFSD